MCKKNGLVQNPVILLKNIFMPSHFFMQMYNVSSIKNLRIIILRFHRVMQNISLV